MTNLSFYLNWAAILTGFFGTLFWSHNGKWAKYAALWWLASALLWAWFAYLVSGAEVSRSDRVTILLYLYGAYQYLRKPFVPSEVKEEPRIGVFFKD